MIRTSAQNKLLHYQLGKLNIPQEVKEDLVYQFTNGKETRSSCMTPDQCQALINHLNVLLKSKNKPEPTYTHARWQDDPANKMRMKILSLCHEMDMRLENGKIDMARVNALCIEKGYKHKELNLYTRAELPLLITQIERITRDFLKGK